jgi:outer membrane immunogenic protein
MRNSFLVNLTALAVVAIAGGVITASAADLEGVPYTKENFIMPVYNWSGVYVGGNIGYGWGRSSDASGLSPGGPPALFTDSVRSNMNGIVGGGQLGYNSQMRNWLWGLEADFQGTGQSSNHSFTCPAGVCVTGAALPVTNREQLDFFGTVRGRLGLVIAPTVLLYATGGLAYGQVDANTTLTGATRSQNYIPGYAVGGGIEGVIGGNWTARLEYLYLDLGTVSGTFNSTVVAGGGAGTLASNFSSRITDNIVRVGLNYKFTGPEIAKY